MPKLWEEPHPYYCNLGNYFSGGTVESQYKSWAEFIESEGDADFDMNLVFRWDWLAVVYDGDTDAYKPGPDPNYRDGELRIFWVAQRKGFYRYTMVQVCAADEPTIHAWLQERLDYLMHLWAPLVPRKETDADTNAT